MTLEKLPIHIVQSEAWGKFKEKMGNKAVSAGGVQFTLHKIPLLPFYLGYAPKVSGIEKVDWQKLKEAAMASRCLAVRFDCPNLAAGTDNAARALDIFKNYGRRSPKNTFAKNTVFLDLTPSEETLLSKMQEKTRYNIRLAQKKGVRVRLGNESDLSEFIHLQKETARRQGFFIHPDNYYREVWQNLASEGLVKLLLAEYDDPNLGKKTIAAWLLFIYKGVLYYPYGGSDYQYRNLMASNLLMWEAIKLGKSLDCKIFDMWGVADDPNDPKDPWYGFTRFKLGFGGELVRFIDSYDLVVNRPLYPLFNLSYRLVWVILKIKNKIGASLSISRAGASKL